MSKQHMLANTRTTSIHGFYEVESLECSCGMSFRTRAELNKHIQDMD